MSDRKVHSPLIRPPLETQLLAQRVLVYETVESTNDYALRLGGDGTLVITEQQTAGRGRQGRTWHSPAGLGLWFSLGFDGHLEGMQVVAALSVRDAVRDLCALNIKWPNDLLFGGKKLCGILVEHKDNRTAVGIGLNVNHTLADFPEELHASATSLAMSCGRELDRASILKRILQVFETYHLKSVEGEYVHIHQEWVAACDLLGKRIRWGSVEGKVTSIDARGALCVETSEGEMQLLSGEITTLESVS